MAVGWTMGTIECLLKVDVVDVEVPMQMVRTIDISSVHNRPLLKPAHFTKFLNYTRAMKQHTPFPTTTVTLHRYICIHLLYILSIVMKI